MAKWWEPQFPSLGPYLDHSLPTRSYNCFALAAGETHQRWEPDPGFQYFWPPIAPRDYGPAAFIAAYGTLGYAVCANELLEIGCEKIAIYVEQTGTVAHVARQLFGGLWFSKLGHAEDIIHKSPSSLTSLMYGNPTIFMKRRITLTAEGRATFVVMWRASRN